jgi:hypothetical protein
MAAMTPRPLVLFAALAFALALIAFASPVLDRPTDRDAYEATASRFIVRDCADVHCFRVLVPWLLGPLPGASIVKWKAFAATANLFGAIAVYALSLSWGLSARGAAMAAAMSALGFGSLYTLFDPFTADPLMYAVGPFLAWLLLRDRLAIAGAIAAISVLGKEFAAAPMLIHAAAAAAAGRVAHALRVLAFANVALIVWLTFQLVLIIGFNYGYGGNSSTHLLSGGYLAYWLSRQSWIVSALAIYGEFGVLWLLAPVGLLLATPPMRRFALASIPAALIFAYVQQPDRALWNFHFIATPLAALVLERASAPAAWACVAAFGLANLRLGAQLTVVPSSRGWLALSAIIAIGCVYELRRSNRLVATA